MCLPYICVWMALASGSWFSSVLFRVHKVFSCYIHTFVCAVKHIEMCVRHMNATRYPNNQTIQPDSSQRDGNNNDDDDDDNLQWSNDDICNVIYTQNVEYGSYSSIILACFWTSEKQFNYNISMDPLQFDINRYWTILLINFLACGRCELWQNFCFSFWNFSSTQKLQPSQLYVTNCKRRNFFKKINCFT